MFDVLASISLGHRLKQVYRRSYCNNRLSQSSSRRVPCKINRRTSVARYVGQLRTHFDLVKETHITADGGFFEHKLVPSTSYLFELT